MNDEKHESHKNFITHHSSFIISYIALGSNLGDSAQIIRDAIRQLATLSPKPLLISSLWDTTPVDCPPASGRFVNAVVGLTPFVDETPQTLLVKLKKMERQFGRLPKKKLNEPRLLDLDLIAFGNQKISSASLEIPHPRAHLRRFVLAPLNEIAPDLILAGQNLTVKELLNQLPSDETACRIVIHR